MPAPLPSKSILPLLLRMALALCLVWLLFIYLLNPSFSARGQTPATLSGRVTNSDGAPLFQSIVTLYTFIGESGDGDWVEQYTNATNTNGEYMLSNIGPGTYRLGFGASSAAYRGEFYDDQSSVEDAGDIVITAGAVLTGYDALLSNSGRVVGNVLDAEGNAIEGVSVHILRDLGTGPTVQSSTSTDSQGYFALDAGSADSYWLHFEPDPTLYVGEYYDNKPDLASADPFTIAAESTLTVTAILSRTKSLMGTVTDSSGEAVPDINVNLYQRGTGPEEWFLRDSNATNASGVYHFGNLAHKEFRIEFAHPSIVHEYYNNQSSFETADLLDLANGPEVVIADAVVTRRGVIAGTVVDVEGVPLEGVTIELYRHVEDDWVLAELVFTDQFGDYIAYGDPDTEYRLHFFPNGDLVDEYYDNAPTLEAAQTITTPAHAVIGNINAQLDRYGLVTGNVTNDEGAPLQNVFVQPYWDPMDTGTWTVPPNNAFAVTTDEAGNYSLLLPPTPDFRIGFAHAGYEAEFYVDQPTVATATTISAPLNSVLPNINAQLTPGPVLSGTVTGPESATLQNINVEIYFRDQDGLWTSVALVQTDEQGQYAVGLASGVYRLLFTDTSGRYAREYYDNATLFEQADDIVLMPGHDLTIDAQLTYAPGISGHVMLPAGETTDASVQLLRRMIVGGNAEWVCCPYRAIADQLEGGAYRFPYVAPGEYIVYFTSQPEGIYQPEYYQNQRKVENATIFTVTEQSIFQNIDAVMETYGEVSGSVVNLDDQPLAGIRVTLFNEESLAGDVAASQTITTEVDGRFTFTQVTELPYWLQFSDLSDEYAGEFYDDQPNFEDADTLLVPNGSTLTVTAQLTRAVAITGHVSDLAGQPYENVEVQLYTYWPGRPESWQVYDTTTTDAQGNYHFNGLTPYAKYRVKFEKDGILLYYPNATSLEEAEDVVVTTQALLPNINATISRPGEVKAEFSGTPLAGTGSLSVIFTDQSLGPVSARTWDFGDGATSVQANPIHTYTLHGVYTVTLTITGPVNSSVAQKINYVSLTDLPISALEIEHSAAGGTEPLVGQTIYFSATAEGSNIDYLWDFGDDALGAAATTKGQYVQHSYDAAGTYTVTLTASNGVGEALATVAVTIRQEEEETPLSGLAIHGPSAAFVNESVTFSATVTTGDNVIYTWDFGDTNIMTGSVVSHTYDDAGLYDVHLTASNNVGELQASTSITITERLIPPTPQITRFPRIWSQPQ